MYTTWNNKPDPRRVKRGKPLNAAKSPLQAGKDAEQAELEKTGKEKKMANEYTTKYQVYVVIKGRTYKECGCFFEYDAEKAVECLIEGGEVDDAFYKTI